MVVSICKPHYSNIVNNYNDYYSRCPHRTLIIITSRLEIVVGEDTDHGCEDLAFGGLFKIG